MIASLESQWSIERADGGSRFPRTNFQAARSIVNR